jgi:hypothetical protein
MGLRSNLVKLLKHPKIQFRKRSFWFKRRSKMRMKKKKRRY